MDTIPTDVGQIIINEETAQLLKDSIQMSADFAKGAMLACVVCGAIIGIELSKKLPVVIRKMKDHKEKKVSDNNSDTEK